MQPIGPFLGLGGTLAVFLGQTICLHAQSIVVPSFLAVLVRGGQGSRASSTASQGSHQPGGSRGSHGQSSSGSEWKPSPCLWFSFGDLEVEISFSHQAAEVSFFGGKEKRFGHLPDLRCPRVCR